MTKTFMMVCAMATICNSASLISPNNPNLQYFGRFDFSNPSEVAFEWPGVYIGAAFQGTSCKVILRGNDLFDVLIDGKPVAVIKSRPQTDTIIAANGLEDKTHQLLLKKRSESSSPSFFGGLILDSGKTVVPPPAPPERKIEFIGDSYTAGFANEYGSRECPPDKADSIITSFYNMASPQGRLFQRPVPDQRYLG